MSSRIFTFLLVFALFGSLNAAIVVPPVVTPSDEATATEIDAEAAARAAVLDYRASLKAMSARERRTLKKEQRSALKNALENREDVSENLLLLIIIAIFIPPLAMYLHQGEINSKFWISLILTLLFYVPGLIYTLVTILG